MDRIAAYLAEGYWADMGAAARSFDVAPGAALCVHIDGMSAAGQQYALWAMEAWSYATGLRFELGPESGADIALGGVGPDLVLGAGGSDRLTGGTGADRLRLDDALWAGMWPH